MSTAPDLVLDVWLAISQTLKSEAALCAMAQACKSLNRQLSHDLIWRELVRLKYGASVSESHVASTYGTWRQLCKKVHHTLALVWINHLIRF